MSDLKEARRAAFEKVLSRESFGPMACLDQDGYGGYKTLPVDSAWWAWNAALDSIVVDLPPSISMTDEWRKGYNTGLANAEVAIHAAGVKTR